MNTNKITVKVLAEIAIFSALALALDFLQSGYSKGLFINGGSIGIAMVPVFIIAYRRGLVAGLISGFIVSILQMLGGIYVVTGATYDGAMQFFAPFIQILLDYVLGYTVVGMAGAFSGKYKKGKTIKERILWIVVGTVIGGLLKYACHVLAGGLFWLNQNAKPMFGVTDETWLYSFVYNGAACIPSTILSTAIMVLIGAFYPQLLLTGIKGDGEVSKEVDSDIDSNKENEDGEVYNNEKTL